MAILGFTVADNPLDYLENGFIITKPSPISNFDQTFELSCRIPKGKSVKNCMFYGPSKSLTVDLATGDVYTGNTTEGNPIDGITGILGDPRMCGIQHSVLTKEDLGEWNCVMADEGLFRQGTFQLLTLEAGWAKDIRLPEHIEVRLTIKHLLLSSMS